MENHLKYVGNS